MTLVPFKAEPGHDHRLTFRQQETRNLIMAATGLIIHRLWSAADELIRLKLPLNLTNRAPLSFLRLMHELSATTIFWVREQINLRMSVASCGLKDQAGPVALCRALRVGEVSHQGSSG